MARIAAAFGYLLCLSAAASSTSSAPDAPGPADAAQAAPRATADADPVSASVVKVYATLRNPDLKKPWTKSDPEEVSGSGFIIDGQRIVTNAHVVAYSSTIEIQANGSGDRLPAHVEFLSTGIDLALLTVDDPSFFSSHPALQMTTEPPSPKDPVLVYGYPAGGQSLSITRGIVSRIEYAPYNAGAGGLRVQIDAAINHGNSGGPAIINGKLAGVAFSFLNEAQNIGYIIPTEELQLILDQRKTGQYTGRPVALDGMQTLDNPALRRFLKIDPSVHGIVVSRPYEDEASYPIRQWDVITRIGDVDVDDQGNVPLKGDVRVNMAYFFLKEAKDGYVPVTVARGGKLVKTRLPVARTVPTLFPDLEGKYPSYFIFGPMVFSRASRLLIGALAVDTPTVRYVTDMASPLVTRMSDRPSTPDEELVFIAAPFFPSPLTAGYRNPQYRVVKAVNHTPITSLRRLVRVLRDSTSPFVVIEFADTRGDRLIFHRSELFSSTPTILAENGVRTQGSADMMAEWKSKGE